MSDIAINAEKLSKRYRIGLKKENPESLIAATASVLRSPLDNFRRLRRLNRFSDDGHDADDVIWALNEVSFGVSRGEVVGIIGRNGAGKSTLLKILSRITPPTSGRAVINGRVSSLLEVGTGFHPELTGRENTYLNGTILGMSKQEVKRKFDEIVDFSGVEKFIDTPVKRYSSGMLVRLAFSVAAHLEPDILLVDEVLAVGDAAFQRKSLGRMKKVAKEGRTVLFVSHNMGAVRRITQKCLYLINGGLEAFDNSAQVIDRYIAQTLDQHHHQPDDLNYFRRDGTPATVAQFRRIWVNEDYGEICDVPVGHPFTIFMSLEAMRTLESFSSTINIKNMTGDVITTLITADEGFDHSLQRGLTTVACRIDDLRLPPGNYLVQAGINSGVGTRAWDVVVDYPAFRVVNSGPHMLTYRPDRPGTVLCDKVKWSIVNLEDSKS